MVLFIAAALIVVAANLHHLRSALFEKWPAKESIVSKQGTGVDIQVGLMPGFLIQVY